MKAKKRLVIVTWIASVVSILLAVLFQFFFFGIGRYGEVSAFIVNFSFAVFGSALLGFIMSLVEYFVSKKHALENYYLEALKVYNIFSKIEFLLITEPKDLLMEHFSSEMMNNVFAKQNQSANGSLYEYMKTIWTNTVDIPEPDFSNYTIAAFKDYIEDFVERLIVCMDSYIDIANKKIAFLDTAYAEFDFLFCNKSLRSKIYKEIHIAWKETYASQIHDNLIFSDDCVAYQIGVKPLCKKDLRDFTPEDKIVNKFEEILRHNNVSDKENAFNRLVALFICKLVDEITKSEDDEVEFQYKQGTDTYETLQDRLQRLHKDGMEQFMREEIYYVSANYPEWLFSTYTGSKRKKAIEDLQRTIRILKFYSNNDFAFKDVHNEELFYQNGKILVEMVQLFEKYRIVYPSKHQFLGDLFEQLLNKGFKQNEGQFFTPIPITRFIWDSLPVDRMVKSDRGTVYPKVIDEAVA